MRSERGYINLDFSGLFIGLLVVGAVLGAVVMMVVPWAWGFVKPWLHAVTG